MKGIYRHSFLGNPAMLVSYIWSWYENKIMIECYIFLQLLVGSSLFQEGTPPWNMNARNTNLRSINTSHATVPLKLELLSTCTFSGAKIIFPVVLSRFEAPNTIVNKILYLLTGWGYHFKANRREKTGHARKRSFTARDCKSFTHNLLSLSFSLL